MSAIHCTIGGANTCGLQSRINKTIDASRTFHSAASGVEWIGTEGKEVLCVVLGTGEGQDNISTMPPAYGTCETISSNMREFSRSSGIDQSTPLIRVRRAVTTYLIPKRYIFSLLAFTACCIAVSYNINLSIAIVSMVKHEKENRHHINVNATNNSYASQINKIILILKSLADSE
ncbi:uncharacterized protein TNCV_916221 [Trichonephila clavipes]|nr:uncharacterized protein TNCV_916221 [Trichonephila clavipes]